MVTIETRATWAGLVEMVRKEAKKRGFANVRHNDNCPTPFKALGGAYPFAVMGSQKVPPSIWNLWRGGLREYTVADAHPDMYTGRTFALRVAWTPCEGVEPSEWQAGERRRAMELFEAVEAEFDVEFVLE